MAGVGKILKQAAKMQKRMEALQQELAEREIEVSSGGGAVSVRFSLTQELRALTIDPEFLKEDAVLVSDTIAEAVREGLTKAKADNEAEMNKLTQSMQLPGVPGLF